MDLGENKDLHLYSSVVCENRYVFCWLSRGQLSGSLISAAFEIQTLRGRI